MEIDNEKENEDAVEQLNAEALQATGTQNHLETVINRWLYLEPILSSGDGELGAKFSRVDRDFRQMMRGAAVDLRLTALLHSPRLPSLLDSILTQLADCQAALDNYITDKRNLFPRFYFLSDDDLLELLGQAREGSEGREVVLQTHLKKIFPGTTGVKLGPKALSITALCSHDGEKLILDKPVDIDVSVEIWLKKLEDEMRSSLKTSIHRCLINSSFEFQNAFSFPTQVLCLAQNIRFTEQTERSIVSKDLHVLRENTNTELHNYINIDLSDGENEAERLKRQALILQCTHYLSILDLLIDNRVTSSANWLWQKQLRFYLLDKQDVVARMGLAQISYTYEYLGSNTGQLVRTALTDHCFLILTQSIHLGLAGNPFGPAGTGKTESVKALGALLGRLVLVFNCDEAMDAICMGRLLTGLALSGSWGCFDEFNRLTSQTLASISRSFISLLSAMTQKCPAQSSVAVLNDNELQVSPGCGIFCTMNPAGGVYGGRRALPDSVARALRPVAMWEPCVEDIATALLAVHAGGDARALAGRLVLTFGLARDLLSPMHHYDWGLRALKTIIQSCGKALTTASRKNFGGLVNEKEQMTLMVKALQLNTLSKLSFQDSERFGAILSAVFPDIKQAEQIPSDLRDIENSYKDLNLQYNTTQVGKCTELYEQLQQRMGVVVVGPPGSGKTTIRRILKHTLNQLGKNVVEHSICAKAISRDQLLGNIDQDTRLWIDGVLSSTALLVSNEPPDTWSWVVCDSDVDPEWIESLNSVLDDNRLLTLPSGWRIQFGSNVNFIFETHSLEHASPATISRMGIIFLSEEESCVQELIQTWADAHSQGNELSGIMIPLLQECLKKFLEWTSNNINEFLLKIYTISLVKQILSQYSAMSNGAGDISGPEIVVGLAFVRAICPLLKLKAAETFLDSVSSWASVSSHLISVDDTYTPSKTIDDTSLLLSTRLSKAQDIMSSWAMSGNHFMVVGPKACGINLLTEYVLRESQDTLIITIKCTPMLEPSHIVQVLKKYMSSKSGSGGKLSTILLIKSLHRSPVDKWGTCPVQAFILQIIQYGGFWDSNAAEVVGDNSRMYWYKLRKLQVVMTCSHQGFKLCPRLLNAVNVTIIREPEERELYEITNIHLERHLKSIGYKLHSDEMKELCDNMFSLYKEVSATFISQAHYKWYTNALTRWCESLELYKTNSKQTLMMAICNEAADIFKNRLVTQKEKNIYQNMVEKYFLAPKADSCFMTVLTNNYVSMELTEEKIWTATLQKTMNQLITGSELNVFGQYGPEVCPEIAELCCSISRTTNGEVLVIIGPVGLGRRAAVQLAAALLPAKVYHVRTGDEFKTQVKNAMMSSGFDSCKSILLVEEGANSSTSDTVFGAIETGFGQDGIQQLISDQEIDMMMSQAKLNGKDDVKKQMFLKNVKENLGLVVLLDTKQDSLSKLIENFPIIYQQCHLLWMECWCDETLENMPQLVIERLRKENIGSTTLDGIKEVDFMNGFTNIFLSLDQPFLRTPARYIGFIKSYFHIWSDKSLKLRKRQEVLQAGIAALTKAREEVNALKSDAAKQESALSEKQEKANHALNQIGATVQSATSQKEEMQTLKKNIELENAQLHTRKLAIEAELASVEPIIQEARSAVGDIKPESLSEIRSLRAPPEVVRDVLEGVLRLMGIADTSWHSMKTFLSKRGVKEDIRSFDASHIKPENLLSVEKLLQSHAQSFNEKTAKRASAACAPLAAWVHANVAYATALARIQPLEKEQRSLKKNLNQAESQLEALSNDLQSVDERVAMLKEQLSKYTKEGTEIEIKLAAAKETILRTENLVDKLSGEYHTWAQNLTELSKETAELSIKSLLASAFLSYLTNATEDNARLKLKEWCNELGHEDKDYDIISFLVTQDQQLQWNADGLAADINTLKNAVVISKGLNSNKCGLTPLIIDPDGEALRWLRSILKDTSHDIVSLHSERFNTALQHAIRFGKTLVIEEVTEISDKWSSLLQNLPIAALSSINATFKLILYSRDTSLPSRLQSYHRALLSVVDFTPQLQGLTDHLMRFALESEKPEIKEKLDSLKQEKVQLQKQQYHLQEALLQQLSSDVEILHDATLLASLSNNRSSSIAISEALSNTNALEEEVTQSFMKYHDSARKAAMLLMSIREIALHRYPLASIPVDTILHIYVKAIDHGRSMKNPAELNTESIVQYLTTNIIERVMIGLRKHDRSTVILHLLHQMSNKEQVSDEVWDRFIGLPNTLIAPSTGEGVKGLPHWIPKDRTKQALFLKDTLPDLYDRLQLNDGSLWEPYVTNPDYSTIPHKINLSVFQKVFILQTLNPEKLYNGLLHMIQQYLGSGVLTNVSDPLCAAEHWAGIDGQVVRPILVVGGSGTQPAEHVQTLAERLVGGHKLKQLWISNDQAVTMRKIEDAVEWGVREGSWIVISVGAAPCYPALQTYLANFTHAGINIENTQFRLWIIFEDRDVPSLITSSCVNVMLEAPEGLKNNVMRTLTLWNNHETHDSKMTRSLFCLALLHALVQERRAYLPQGWTQWYPFDWGDLSAGYNIITSPNSAGIDNTTTGKRTPAGLCEAIYAGRIHSKADLDILSTLIEEYMCERSFAHNWKPRGINVELPMSTQLQAYGNAINQFPNMDTPTQLALADNARATWEVRAADSILMGLKQLRHHNSGQTADDTTSVKRSIAPILSLWKKLNSGPESMLKSRVDVKTHNATDWLAGVWAQEIQDLEALYRVIHNTLAAAAKGDRFVAESLIMDEVPQDWKRLWNGPDTVINYIKEVHYRCTQMRKKIVADNISMKTEFEIDLKSLLVPKRLLAALRITTSQQLQCPPDSLVMQCSWASQPATNGSTSVTLQGLRIEGGVWFADDGSIRACNETTPPVVVAPPITIYYKQKEDNAYGLNDTLMDIPVYTNNKRQELISILKAPIHRQFTRNTWILNAVALIICEVD